MIVQLPNDRLILNGHKLHTVNDLFAYVSKRLKISESIHSIDQLIAILSNYETLQIAIRHSDTFLWSESEKKRTEIIKALEQHRLVKIT